MKPLLNYYENGLANSMKTFVATDPQCPAMRIFLDGNDLSHRALEIRAFHSPGIPVHGWVKMLTDPPLQVDGRAIIEQQIGTVVWYPVDL